MKQQSPEVDLDRRISSLAQLESEALAEGNESLATVWHRRKERAESERARIRALTQSKN